MRPSLVTALIAAAACLALPAASRAADAVLVADPAAEQITALNGTVVWVSGAFGSQRLMQRAPDGTIGAVKRAPVARSYGAIDLGLSSDRALRLTYRRCDAGGRCKVLWDDLDGRRATFRGLTSPRCAISAISQWRTRVAYGLSCSGSLANRKLTGLYVRQGSRRPVRLRRPNDAVRFAIREIESVDLRGTRVAAVAGDIYDYSFSETTLGRGMQSFLAAASEGESDASARGLALQDASTHWTLTLAQHGGDPNASVIFRMRRGCLRAQRLERPSPDGPDFEATDLAVDGAALYLVRPGTGIVSHAFAPDPAPRCG